MYKRQSERDGGQNWDTYYPGGRTPLDDVSNEDHTFPPRQRGLFFNDDLVDESPQPVERSIIERILTSLNSGSDGRDVQTTTSFPVAKPASRFRGMGLVDELIQGFANGEARDPKLTKDWQVHQWTHPDFFTVEYLQHAQEFSSGEVCTVVDVFAAAPEVGTLQEMGGCDILYLPELNTDDPYYNPLFMKQQDKDKYAGRETYI